MGLRAEIEEDLLETLEDSDDYGLPVELISPVDGARQTKSANDPTADLTGQIIYETLRQSEDGIPIIEHKPVVTLRISSLDRVPANGEKWSVIIPISPVAGADTETFILEKAMQDGRSIGYVRLYLRRAVQTP